MPADIRILGDRLLHAGRWVTLKEKSYRDARGREGRWTYAERTGGQTAVVIVARTALTGALIVIEQFRLPFERNVLEFPAGLVEPGEFAAFLDRCLREGLLLDAKLFVYLKEAAC